MTETKLAMLVVVALSIAGVAADLAIKRAADAGSLASPYLYLGAAIYAGSAFGWYYALRTLNLATLGGIYSVVTVLLLVLAGVVIYGEQLRPVEMVVVAVALGAIWALWRFL